MMNLSRRLYMSTLLALGVFMHLPWASARADDNALPLKRETQPTAAADATTAEIITLGTRSARAIALLGNPQVSSTIQCLHRRMITFADGTKIIFVNDSAVSALPGGLALGSPAEGFIIERQSKRIVIEPSLVVGNAAPPPYDVPKIQVEGSFIYAPKIIEVPQPCYKGCLQPPSCSSCKGWRWK